MRETTEVDNQQTKRIANWNVSVASFLRSRKARSTAIPLLVVGLIAASTSFAAQAASDTSPVSNTSTPTSQESTKQETKVIQQQDSNQQDTTPPKTTESVEDRGDGATTNVTVNGETITVPENGTYQRSTKDGNTKTDVRVDSQHQSSSSGNAAQGGASNYSSSDIRVNVQSNSSSESKSD